MAHSTNRPSAGGLVGNVARRIVHPRHLVRAIRLQRGKKRVARARSDAQLLLYSKIFTSGFLHYGYFEDPDTDPREVSLRDIERAQHAYAEQLLHHVVDAEAPVLDVGCGMGGLLTALRDRGFQPVALSPDRNQVLHVRERHPEVPCIRSKFEKLDAEEHAGRFGTVIMSESFQYVKLNATLPLVRSIIQPGGRWIVCDHFRIDDAEGPGHSWTEFASRVSDEGWTVIAERDLTPHVLPSLAYLHMWGNEILRPGFDYFFERLERKEPGLHYLCETGLESIGRTIDDHLVQVDPEYFARTQRYMLSVLERPAEDAPDERRQA